MARRKLSPGIHFVNIKGKRRKVRVLKNGQWRFMKMGGSSKKSKSKRSRPKARKVTRRRRSSSKKVRKMAKGKGSLFGNLSGAGMVEDVAIGYLGMSFFAGMGEARLPFTRAVQGVAGHALNRRGKGRLVYAISDLLDVYLAKGAGLDSLLSQITNSIKLGV